MKKTLITLSALLLIGCGSRKVETSKETVKEEVTQTVKTEMKTDTNETVKVIDTSETTEIEFIPIDNNRPIIYGTTKVYNAKIRHVKRKNGITTVSDKKVAQIKRNDLKTVGKREVKVKDKVSERESFNYWWLILVLGISYLAYRYLRRTNVI
jgi:hypothetical protein